MTNMEWSNVIFLMATLRPEGLWTAEHTTPSGKLANGRRESMTKLRAAVPQN